MSVIVNMSRRDFLKAGVIAGGGLILGFSMPGAQNALGQALAGSGEGPVALNAFVRIGNR